MNDTNQSITHHHSNRQAEKQASNRSGMQSITQAIKQGCNMKAMHANTQALNQSTIRLAPNRASLQAAPSGRHLKCAKDMQRCDDRKEGFAAERL